MLHFKICIIVAGGISEAYLIPYPPESRPHLDSLQVDLLCAQSLPASQPHRPGRRLEGKQSARLNVSERLRLDPCWLSGPDVPRFHELEGHLLPSRVLYEVVHPWPGVRDDDTEEDPAEGIVGGGRELVEESDEGEGESESVGRERGARGEDRIRSRSGVAAFEEVRGRRRGSRWDG